MIKLFKRKRRIGCPACYDSRTIGFGADLLESKYDSKIEQAELIGKTQTFKCLRCETLYYWENNIFEKIEPTRLQTLTSFWETEHKLSDHLMSQLELIGFSTDWNLGRLAPAMIELKNGDVHDFATIRICKKPPINAYSLAYKQIFFVEEVANIQPSKFALSQEIRKKSSLAEERRMGFYPTILRSEDSKEVAINIETIFFKHKNIIGSNLTLAHQNWDHKKKYLFTDKIENAVLVVAR